MGLYSEEVSLYLTDLRVNICGHEFKNPIIAASGTFGFGREYNEFYDVSILGGISSKGLTLNPKKGNKGIRLYETPSGLINSIGLENPGVEEFIKKELPFMKSLNIKVLANLGGADIQEYVEGAKLLNRSDVDFIELNISCPNVKEGGMAFGIKCENADEVVRAVRKVCDKKLIVKLSPNAYDIVDMAKTCQNAGADALSLVNTFSAVAIDIFARKPVFKNIKAGLSGPAIKPIALRMVYDVCKNVEIPVIGMGGIVSFKDVFEFIMAGAHAVQVGTANFIEPVTCKNIINDMELFMNEKGIQSVDEIRKIF